LFSSPVREVTQPTPVVPLLSNATARPEPKRDESQHDDSGDVVGVDLVWNEYKDDNQALRYSLGAEYPQIISPDTRATRAFNRAVEAHIFGRITPLRDALLRSPRREKDLPDIADELRYSVSVAYARPDLISVRLEAHDYSWPAAHGGNTSTSITFDLRSGRRISLESLFRAHSSYLSVIAQYCEEELNRRGILCGPGTLFAGGTSPTAKHYRTWNVTKDGLMITFDEYQVAAHTEGQPSVIVPYETLQTIIDPKGPLGTFLQR
jgi:hypothetical protein